LFKKLENMIKKDIAESRCLISQTILFGLLLIFITSNILKADPVHPRGFINAEQIPELRAKIDKEPFRAMCLNIRKTALQQQEEQQQRDYEPYSDSRLLGN